MKAHVAHIHIKDCQNPLSGETEPEYTMPGLGLAKIKEILADAKAIDYSGAIAIEPHVATVFHTADPTDVDWDECYRSYVEYGKAFKSLLQGV